MASRSRISLTLACAMACGCGDDITSGPAYSVIVYGRENMWVHASNPIASHAILDLDRTTDWEIERAYDPSIFTPERLAVTDVVVFSVTSGDVLDAPAREALETFFTEGGGFVGIHSASATEYSWPYYHEQLVPVWFKTHPTPQNVVPGVLTLESESPLLVDVPERWMRSDEWYTFYERPEDLGLELLLALDESSMGPDYTQEYRVGYHPLAFTHERTGGRTFYTALGHTEESYSDPVFMGIIERAIGWSAEPRYAARTASER